MAAVALVAATVGWGPSGASGKPRLTAPATPPPAQLNAGVPVARQAYAPDPSEAYMQTWNAYYRSRDGHHIFANVGLSNLGFGSTCGLNLAVTTPDGRTLLRTEQLDAEEALKASRDAVALRCGRTAMSGDPLRLRIRGELADMGLDVTVVQGPPGADTGTLWLDGGRTQFVRYNVPHLGSRMTGRIKYDGRWRPIEGWGAVEHLVTNHGIEKFSRVWHRVRLMTDELCLLIGGFSPTDDYEGGVHYIVLARGDRILAVSNRVRIQTVGRKAHGESGYDVPTALSVTVDDPLLRLEGEVTSLGLIGEFDVLQQLHPVFRAIVRVFFANPWIFRHRSRVGVKWRLDGAEEERAEAEAMHEVIYVNK